MKYNIGAVNIFAWGPCPEHCQQFAHRDTGRGYHDLDLSGNERVAALRRFYLRQDDPRKQFMFVYGVGIIAWEDVNWGTAGKMVTE